MKTSLEGLKIVDLSRILAGPYACQVLGDLGAQVIKIEKPPLGDDTRGWGPPFVESDGHNSSAYFYSANRNKKSLALNLSSPEDKKHLDHLISQADVVVENFRPKSLKRLGLDHDTLKTKNPKLIHCSIQSFGTGSPYQDRPAYDALIQAMGGIMSVTGPTNHPSRVGVAITDIATGLYAAIGILSALRERETSGLGQHLEISLFDTQVSWLANVAMNFLVSGDTPQAYGTAHPNIVPYQTFECSDASLFLAIGNDSQFEKFSVTCNQNWHQNPQWQTNAGRVQDREKLIPVIQEMFQSQGRDHWIALLTHAGLPVAPVNDLSDLSQDPHVKEMGLFRKLDQSEIPTLKSPLKFSRTPIENYKAPDASPREDKFDFSVFK